MTTITKLEAVNRYPGSRQRFSVTTELRYNGRQIGVCFIAPDEAGRQVHSGPDVPGPWASTFGIASVISAHPIPPTPTVEVADGDRVEIEGVVFEVGPPRNRFDRYPTLTVVSP